MLLRPCVHIYFLDFSGRCECYPASKFQTSRHPSLDERHESSIKANFFQHSFHLSSCVFASVCITVFYSVAVCMLFQFNFTVLQNVSLFNFKISFSISSSYFHQFLYNLTYKYNPFPLLPFSLAIFALSRINGRCLAWRNVNAYAALTFFLPHNFLSSWKTASYTCISITNPNIFLWRATKHDDFFSSFIYIPSSNFIFIFFLWGKE